jgi:NADPH2:quinone reductase
MRVVVTQLGDDPMQAIAEHTTLEETPAPDPSTLATHDVLVEIHAAAVGWVDLLMTSGQYQHMAKPPYTPGLEYAGVVAWAGSSHVRPAIASSSIRSSRGRARTAPTSRTVASRRTPSRPARP